MPVWLAAKYQLPQQAVWQIDHMRQTMCAKPASWLMLRSFVWCIGQDSLLDMILGLGQHVNKRLQSPALRFHIALSNALQVVSHEARSMAVSVEALSFSPSVLVIMQIMAFAPYPELV